MFPLRLRWMIVFFAGLTLSLACSLPALPQLPGLPRLPGREPAAPATEKAAPDLSPAPTRLLERIPESPASRPTPQRTVTPLAPPRTQPAAPTLPVGSLNANPPEKPVRLVFIHHSTGEGWLNDEGGGLGLALRDNRYFVSDTNYGWGSEDDELGGPIGDFTDIGHWWTWFLGPQRDGTMKALYQEDGQYSEYSRLNNSPGGENEIILFKSCFPNSALEGKPGDPAVNGQNPLRGQDASSEAMTVANAKGIYNDLLPYFASRPDRLFVVITQPPLVKGDTTTAQAVNARALASWLTNEWLKDYPQRNVAVFDFFNVLTSSGGRTSVNDLNAEKGNHHRFRAGKIEHLVDPAFGNFAAYASAADDSHPTAAGGKKAAGEFVPLLNIYYHRWKGN